MEVIVKENIMDASLILHALAWMVDLHIPAQHFSLYLLIQYPTLILIINQ